MSTAPTNRGNPLWSPVSGIMVSGSIASALFPAFIAGLQSIKAWVKVFPPLSASCPNKGSIFSRSPAIHPELPEVLPTRFVPCDVVIIPDTSSCEVPVELFPETMVLENSASLLGWILTPPPEPVDVLFAIVELIK